MATLTSTGNGDIAGDIYGTGSGPSDGDTVNLEHDHTIEANFTQISTKLYLKNGSTLDTRNAADSTNYNLAVKAIYVYAASLNLRNGTHQFLGDGSSGTAFNMYSTTANTTLAGCTIQCNGFGLRGILNQTLSNTIQWGTGEDDESILNIGNSTMANIGSEEGDYNDGTGWEDATRVHLDMNGAGENSGRQLDLVEYAGYVDGDGPIFYNFASFKMSDWNGQIFRFDHSRNDTEWSFSNACCMTWGRGGHSTTSNSSTANQTEGNFTATDSVYFLNGGWSSNQSLANSVWVYGDMRLGTNAELSDSNSISYYCGSWKTNDSGGDNHIPNAYHRIDGDLIFDSSNSWKAQMLAPNFTFYEDDTPDTAAMDPDLTASDRLHGALMVFGDIVDIGVKGRISTKEIDWTGGHNNATVTDQEILWVYGIDSGTWKIVIGVGANSGGWNNDGSHTGSFTYGNWEERAVSYLNPSGISLGTKPDSGTNSIQLIRAGSRTDDSNLIFDEDATFANITIDANCTITVEAEMTVTYTGTFTNNGSLGSNTTHNAGAKTITGAAANRTCSVTGNWNATATWGGSAVPTSDDPVVINTARTATVNVDANAKSVLFNSGSGQIVLANGSTLNVPVAQSGDDGKLTLQHADSSITGTGNIKGLSAASPLHCTFRSDTNCEIVGNLENCYLKSGSDITIHGSAINCTFEDSTANIRVWTQTQDSQQMLDSDPDGDDDLRLERPALDSNLQLTN